MSTTVLTDATPLLVDPTAVNYQPDEAQADLDHEAVYKRFPARKKRMLVGLVSFTGLLPPFVSETFVPSIPQIAHDIGSTGSTVSLAISLSVLTSAFGTMLLATYSSFYGRRPIYLFGMPLLAIGSLGVGRSTTVPELLAWRVLQAFGVSGGLALGAAAISDLYKLEERGTAMGIFFAGVLLGAGLAPPIGGGIAYYTSWRVVQYALGAAGAVMFVVLYLIFPETMHPGKRGIDVYAENTGRRPRFMFLNPLSSLALLRSPNLLFMSIGGFFLLLTEYVLLTPIAYTIGARYNIKNEFLVGACFLPLGFGNCIGAPIAGRISDIMVIKWKQRRHGEWVPEDRLRATILPAMTMVPLSVLLAGLFTQYVDGTLGLILNLLCLFMNGLGIDFVLSPAAAYYVDILHHRSAESMAATAGLRNSILALAIAGIFPSIDKFGVAGNGAITAIFAWIGAGMFWLTIRYGDKMRAWVDIGYSTTSNN